MDKEELLVYIKNLVNINKIKNVDQKLEIILEKYYSERQLFRPLQETYKKLARLIIEKEFPDMKTWNRIAYKEYYLSSMTIVYSTGITWKELEKIITKEIKDILRGE